MSKVVHNGDTDSNDRTTTTITLRSPSLFTLTRASLVHHTSGHHSACVGGGDIDGCRGGGQGAGDSAAVRAGGRDWPRGLHA